MLRTLFFLLLWLPPMREGWKRGERAGGGEASCVVPVEGKKPCGENYAVSS